MKELTGKMIVPKTASHRQDMNDKDLLSSQKENKILKILVKVNNDIFGFWKSVEITSTCRLSDRHQSTQMN